MSFTDTLKAVWGGIQKFHTNPSTKSSTKVTMYWLIFSAVLIAWLVVGIPLLSIFYPQISSFGAYTSGVITSLIGGSAISFITSETTKTYESVKTVEIPK